MVLVGQKVALNIIAICAFSQRFFIVFLLLTYVECPETEQLVNVLFFFLS